MGNYWEKQPYNSIRKQKTFNWKEIREIIRTVRKHHQIVKLANLSVLRQLMK